MNVRLAYGRSGLDIEVPDARTTVVEPTHVPGAEDETGALRAALAAPVAGPRLRDLARPGQSVAISICDGTRAQPRHLMVPAVLEELAGIVEDRDVVIMVATGTHRGNSDAELREMLGEEIVERIEVVNHDARASETLVDLGVHGNGVPVKVNRRWVEADLRITTGFVEPHFFAGFSGGPKLVTPGLAGLDTVLVLHDAARIGHPKATWGVVYGNPIHDDVRAAAAAAPAPFSFDVILNREQRIIAAYAGEMQPMHDAACADARRYAMQGVTAPFDVVVTSNSGFPLDQNLYQAVKGMSAAAKIVKDGGTIVCAAECRDGFPGHGSFRELLGSRGSPSELIEAITTAPKVVPDQWQVQIQANIQSRADVHFYSDFLSDVELREAHLTPTHDVSATVEEALAAAGPDATLCVLPEGPQTIAFVEGGRS
ncbi:MAG: nickel-dependent lactate racemase [Solirubrobacteraceae bacterium]